MSESLSQWRNARRLSQAEMAAMVSAVLGRPVHGPSICQWEKGVMPGADVAEAIRLVTGGEVTANSYGRKDRSCRSV